MKRANWNMRLKHVFLTNWEIEITSLVKVIDSHMVALVRIRNSCHFKDKTWDLTKSMFSRMRLINDQDECVQHLKGGKAELSKKVESGCLAGTREGVRCRRGTTSSPIKIYKMQGTRHWICQKKIRDYSFWAKKLHQKTSICDICYWEAVKYNLAPLSTTLAENCFA